MSHNYSEIWEEFEATALAEADKIITELQLWDWLKTTSWEEINSSEMILRIITKLSHDYLTSFVLKNLQDVAKNGWEAHCRLRKIEIEKKKRQEIVERLRGLCLEGKMDYAVYEKIRDTA